MPIISDLNTFNIVYHDSIPIDQKIPMTLNESSRSEIFVYDGRIERRGGSSIVFPKHSFEIDLPEDVPLAELPSDDDWILNANYIDKTFMRHVLSYELFAEMHPNNLVSESQFIELELNHAYNGLYVLMEKLDKSSLEIDGTDSLAFIFKEPHIFRESYQDIVPQKEDNFHQQTFPKISKDDKREYLERTRDMILNSHDSVFQYKINELFDMDNIIDWHLLLLITNNGDGILKNFYLYKKDSKTPMRVTPWDYDHSFGRDGDNELNLDERPLDIRRSILFDRLLDHQWYRTALSQRWFELNKSHILSKSGLKNRIDAHSAGIKEAAEKNFIKWPTTSEWYYDNNNFDQEVELMKQFIDLRHARLTGYFNEI